MYEEIITVGLALWLGLPAWIANSTPVIFGGGRPIDGGRFFRDGHRLLGDGKTVRGFLVGIVCGTLTGTVQVISAPTVSVEMAKYVSVTQDMEAILRLSSVTASPAIGVIVALLLSLGTLTGDIIGSFIKRRVDVQSGGPSPVLDQIGFILLALIFAVPMLKPNGQYVMILILLTLGIHWLSNAMGYLLGFKKHPW